MDENRVKMSSKLTSDLKHAKTIRKRSISLTDKENLADEPKTKIKKRQSLSLDSSSII